MARAKRSKSSAVWAADDSTAEVSPFRVNQKAPAEARFERTLFWRKFFIYGFFFLAAASVLMQLNQFVQESNKPAPKAVTSATVNSSTGKAVASAALKAWMSAEPSPVPGGVLLSWDGFDSIAAGVTQSSSDPGANAGELHHFSIAVPGRDATLYYDATVLVSVDSKLGAIAVGAPALLPVAPAAQTGWSSAIWAGFKTTTTSGPVKDAVSAWAKAFTASPADLRLAVGDPNDAHAYMPLAGAQIADVQVTNTAGKVLNDGIETKTLLVRATVNITWAEGTSSPMTYDLLVESANTAAPRVTAWGGAGTGPSLKAYQNAVSGRDVGTAAPTPTPTPTEAAR
ncbi:hypothetical protein [Microbacterium sp. 13-71-7]|uniref:hypothetical protein n=1 Tax=Microbacterium sp. 13-71-7 TaxID=1970399 RepID=UPI0025D4E8EF|nr:hypothetical protein [Microbacterium sp. 13-71-7]